MKKRILGIDTGTNSIGWAIVDCDDEVSENRYALIDKKQKQMAINEVKDNFIFELAQTEVEDCISTEYMGDYDSLYKFCESKIEKDSFRQTVEYRYPMLLGIMQYCDIQEKVKEKIKELLYDKFNI